MMQKAHPDAPDASRKAAIECSPRRKPWVRIRII
jgi:hypothetical protein